MLYKQAIFKNTTNLAASGVLTSPNLGGMMASRITGFVHSDTTATLEIQHSSDGTNFYTVDTINVSAGSTVGYDHDVYSAWVRVVVTNTNATTAQTSFEVNAYLLDN